METDALLCRAGEAPEGESDEEGDDSESVRQLASYRFSCAVLTMIGTAGPRDHSGRRRIASVSQTVEHYAEYNIYATTTIPVLVDRSRRSRPSQPNQPRVRYILPGSRRSSADIQLSSRRTNSDTRSRSPAKASDDWTFPRLARPSPNFRLSCFRRAHSRGTLHLRQRRKRNSLLLPSGSPCRSARYRSSDSAYPRRELCSERCERSRFVRY